MLRRVDAGIETRIEIVVSPEDDAELRRVSLTNHGTRTRTLDLTSYAEVVLAPADADLAHPAFSNLFVETFAMPERDALICGAAAALRHRAGCISCTCSAAAAGSSTAREYRNRPRPVHRPRPDARPPRPPSPTGRRCRTPPDRCSTRSSACARRVRLPPGAHGPPHLHDRLRRQPRGSAAAGREVPRPPRGRARAGARQHPQPDRTAPPRR